MERMRMIFVIVVLGLASALLGACGGGGGGAVVTRADSAGVEIVTAGAEDVLLDWRLEPRLTLGGEDEGPQSFYRIWLNGVGADRDGRLYVLDSEAKRVIVFGPDGSYLRSMGQEGGGPGEFKSAFFMDVAPDGTVSVFDYAKMALVRWDGAGNVIPEMRFPFPPMSRSRFMAVRDGGYVVVAGGMGANGERAARLLRVAGEDTTLLAEATQPNNGFAMFKKCGGGVNQPPIFTPQVSWDDRAGQLAVAATGAYAVDIYRDGTLVRSVRRTIPALEATDEVAEREMAKGFTIDFGRGPCTVPADEYVQAVGHADMVPPIRQVGLAGDGSLWVQRWVPGEETPPIDVFDATGAYMGTLPAGTSFPVLFLPDGGVGVVSTDENDVQRLVVESVVKTAGAG